MASGRTERFQLSQWQAGDPVLREEFNEDNARLDQVIPRLVMGTYTGNGAAQRTIELGFRPKAVLLSHENGYTCYYFNGYNCYGGLILDGIPLRLDNAQGREICAEITDNGLWVRYSPDTRGQLNVFTNANGQVYHYVALC